MARVKYYMGQSSNDYQHYWFIMNVRDTIKQSVTMLQEYERKRDFSRTSEPIPQQASGEGPLVFVVHKHAARQLHYDLRLEVDGVLKSWAVPQGPSLDPAKKRLAVMVEDHPLDYRFFEGVIPSEQYGAGKVIVWDQGTYSPDEEGKFFVSDRPRTEERMRNGLGEGIISIFICGHKMKGAWILVRMKNKGNNWLLIKYKDKFAEPEGNILSNDKSVLSGLSINYLQ